MRPSFWAFFDLRPAFALPLVDQRLIALQGAADGLLYAPVQLPQDAPNVSGMVVDLKIPLDQVGDPLAGPQRSFITQALRALLE